MGKRKNTNYNQPRRENPIVARTGRVRRGLAQVGEPSHLPRQVVARGLLQDLSESLPEQFSQILQTLKAVIYEQPHKIQFLAEICLRSRDEFLFLALEMAHHETCAALLAGDYGKLKCFFRFLCALSPRISNTDVLVGTLSKMLELSADEQQPTGARLILYKTALISSIYLPNELLTDEIKQAFNCELPKCDLDAGFTDLDSNVPKSLDVQLKSAAKELIDCDWNCKLLSDALLTDDLDKKGSKQPQSSTNKEETKPEEEPKEESKEEPKESETKEYTDSAEPQESAESVEPKEPSESSEPKEDQMDLDADTLLLPPPDNFIIRSIHFPEELNQVAIESTGVKLFTENKTTPPDDSLAHVVLTDVLTDNIKRMDFNRREVTRQLMVIDMFFNDDLFAPPGAPLDALENKYKIEDVALEAVFGLLLSLEPVTSGTSGDDYYLPKVYFHSLLIEACVLAPQDIAPVLGRTLRFIFNNLEKCCAETAFVVIDWFAHHVSNFAFTWKWNEWTSALELDDLHPKKVFIKGLLEKQVRLSYPQRVRDVLPQEFKQFVTDPPEPSLAYLSEPASESDSAGTKAVYDPETVNGFLESLKDDKDVSTTLDSCETPGRLLIASLCQLGSRSLTHSASYITRFEKLVLKYGTNDTEICETVLEFWNHTPWVGGLIVQQFIDIRAVKPQTYVDFIISSRHMPSSYGFEVLCKYPGEAFASLEKINVSGEFGEWWNSRLKASIIRKNSQYIQQKENEEILKKKRDLELEESERKREEEAAARKLEEEEASKNMTEESKDESKEELKEESKEEVKEEVKEESKEEPKEEPKEDSKEESKDQSMEKPSEELSEESKQNVATSNSADGTVEENPDAEMKDADHSSSADKADEN